MTYGISIIGVWLQCIQIQSDNEYLERLNYHLSTSLDAIVESHKRK